jgi:hypothetical protein
MHQQVVTDKDRKLAQKCVECPVCRRARDKQKGLAYWFVKRLEGGICPSCKAYERVYGRKAHEPVPAEQNVVGT